MSEDPNCAYKIPYLEREIAKLKRTIVKLEEQVEMLIRWRNVQLRKEA